MNKAIALRAHDVLRVSIVVADPERARALAAIVAEAGHRVVAADGVDVVLAEAPFESDGTPAVVLGGNEESAGLLPRDATAGQIDAALRAVAAGLIVRPAPEMGFSLLAERELRGILTPREIEVLTAISDGLGNKSIARRLDISLHTVKFHIESIFRKLAVRSRAEAVARGLHRVQL